MQETENPKRLWISIHALREEGDITCCSRSSRHSDFYPRPPRGGRHVLDFGLIQTALFLSTPSARRATKAQQPEAAKKTRFLSTPSARRATLPECLSPGP